MNLEKFSSDAMKIVEESQSLAIKNVDFGGSTQTSLANSINSSASNGQSSINTSFFPRFFGTSDLKVKNYGIKKNFPDRVVAEKLLLENGISKDLIP